MLESEPLNEEPESPLEVLQLLHLFTIEVETTKIIAL